MHFSHVSSFVAYLLPKKQILSFWNLRGTGAADMRLILGIPRKRVLTRPAVRAGNILRARTEIGCVPLSWQGVAGRPYFTPRPPFRRGGHRGCCQYRSNV